MPTPWKWDPREDNKFDDPTRGEVVTRVGEGLLDWLMMKDGDVHINNRETTVIMLAMRAMYDYTKEHGHG